MESVVVELGPVGRVGAMGTSDVVVVESVVLELLVSEPHTTLVCRFQMPRLKADSTTVLHPSSLVVVVVTGGKEASVVVVVG